MEGTNPGPSIPRGSLDPVKARRAAADPKRPGENCLAPPGHWVLTIDRNACEGNGDCVAVCPYSVFELGTLTDSEYKLLGVAGKVKAWGHRRKTARTPRSTACRSCGLCVVACPEDAITLGRGPQEFWLRRMADRCVPGDFEVVGSM
ncbi:MAG: 4Fe-4S dicluster domain-containing protein [Thermoplasmata archaeon]